MVLYPHLGEASIMSLPASRIRTGGLYADFANLDATTQPDAPPTEKSVGINKKKKKKKRESSSHNNKVIFRS
jgi:hypothetical protein